MREPSSVVNDSSRLRFATCMRSVVAQRVDQLVLVHVRAALDADLRRALLEVVLRPVLVAARLAAPAAGAAAVAGVGDPGRLLLAGALAAQRLVLLVVFDARSVVLAGHGRYLLRRSSRRSAYPSANRRKRRYQRSVAP